MDIDWGYREQSGVFFLNEHFFGKRAKRLFYIKSEMHSIFMDKHVQKVHFMFLYGGSKQELYPYRGTIRATPKSKP